ncbi:acyl-CoA dehydrogenase family protein [Mycolicibacterium sp. XJ1819]
MTQPAQLTKDERYELAHSVRAACERLAPEGRVRAVAYDGEGRQPGFDGELWQVLCTQVGVAGVGLPEDLGGAGYGPSALGVIAHELGRSLAPVPFLASAVLATGLLVDMRDRDPDSDSRLSALVEGQRTATAALTGDGGLWRRNAVTMTAEQTSDGWALTGRLRHVLNAAAADDVVVAAIVDGEIAIFLLATAAEGVSVQQENVLDGTRPMATITLERAAALRLSGDGPVDEIITRTIDMTLAVLSAEQVGACERVLEIATEYASTREQFNRPIGSFQAIKHKCADMLVNLEWARSASQAALESHDGSATDESCWRASMAKAVCSEALRDAAHANVQIHGGIGFTWEDAAHLFVRRARTDEVLFGSPAQHWDRLAAVAKIV